MLYSEGLDDAKVFCSNKSSRLCNEELQELDDHFPSTAESTPIHGIVNATYADGEVLDTVEVDITISPVASTLTQKSRQCQRTKLPVSLNMALSVDVVHGQCARLVPTPSSRRAHHNSFTGPENGIPPTPSPAQPSCMLYAASRPTSFACTSAGQQPSAFAARCCRGTDRGKDCMDNWMRLSADASSSGSAISGKAATRDADAAAAGASGVDDSQRKSASVP